MQIEEENESEEQLEKMRERVSITLQQLITYKNEQSEKF